MVSRTMQGAWLVERWLSIARDLHAEVPQRRYEKRGASSFALARDPSLPHR